MADQQNRGGQKQGVNSADTTDQQRGMGSGTQPKENAGRQDRQAERDRQNQDDPSQAPESGDRD